MKIVCELHNTLQSRTMNMFCATQHFIVHVEMVFVQWNDMHCTHHFQLQNDINVFYNRMLLDGLYPFLYMLYNMY